MSPKQLKQIFSFHGSHTPERTQVLLTFRTYRAAYKISDFSISFLLYHKNVNSKTGLCLLFSAVLFNVPESK